MFAFFGWCTWVNLKGLLEGVIMAGTAVIVLLHVWNALVTQLFCTRRHRGRCFACRLRNKFLCPKGIKEDNNTH